MPYLHYFNPFTQSSKSNKVETIFFGSFVRNFFGICFFLLWYDGTTKKITENNYEIWCFVEITWLTEVRYDGMLMVWFICKTIIR